MREGRASVREAKKKEREERALRTRRTARMLLQRRASLPAAQSHLSIHSLVDDAVEGGALEVQGLAGLADALLAWGWEGEKEEGGNRKNARGV